MIRKEGSLSTRVTSAFNQLGLGRGTKTVCPHIPPEAPHPPVPTAQLKCLGTKKALLVTEAGLGREALLCMRSNQNKPVVSAERKGKRGRTCSSRALLNVRSYWDNDQSLRVCCI